MKDSWIKMYRVSLPYKISELGSDCYKCVFSNHLDKVFVNGINEVFVWNLKDGRSEIAKPVASSTWYMESLVPLVIIN